MSYVWLEGLCKVYPHKNLSQCIHIKKYSDEELPTITKEKHGKVKLEWKVSMGID